MPMAGKRRRQGPSVTDPNQNTFPSSTMPSVDEIVVQKPPFNQHKRRNDHAENESSSPSPKRPKHSSSSPSNSKRRNDYPENESPSPKRPRHSSPSNSDALILPDYPMPSQMNLFGATPDNPSWEITRINREARNQADIASAISKAHFISQNNRPKSTKIAYNSKQKLWKEWCTGRGFDDLDTVSTGKLILWLQESIIPKGAQYKGAKRGAMLTESGLEGYVKPIIALYEVFIPFSR
jgi:hypothetical protein